jgi:hypothetical protein
LEKVMETAGLETSTLEALDERNRQFQNHQVFH